MSFLFLQKFLSRPEVYVPPLAPRPLPDVLPKRLTVADVKALFPLSAEMQGYCPVTYLDGKQRYITAVVVGWITDCVLHYHINEEILSKSFLIIFRVWTGKAITILHIVPLALEINVKSPFETHAATGSVLAYCLLWWRQLRYSLSFLYLKPSEVQTNLTKPQ